MPDTGLLLEKMGRLDFAFDVAGTQCGSAASEFAGCMEGLLGKQT